MFSPWALVPLLSALLFALYGLLTRYVARGDAAVGQLLLDRHGRRLAMTPRRALVLGTDDAADWGWMAVLCCTAALAIGC